MINTKITVRKTSGVSSLSDTFVVKLSKNISGITAEDLKFAMGDIELSMQEIEDMMKKAKASEEAAKLSETLSKTSETNSSKSAEEAKKSQDSAKTYETNANKSAMAAKVSENAAKLSETNAKASEDKAKAHADAAKASEVVAKASEVAAKSSETKAKSSETASKASETASKASQDAANKSATAAGTSSTEAKAAAGVATTKATEASTSATSASASEKNAKTSASGAANSAATATAASTAAANSEAAAKTSATDADVRAKAAKASQDAAEASKVAALASKDAAAKSATAASTSSTEAKTAATAAKASETKSTTEANRAKTEADRAEAAANSTEGIKPSDLTQTITEDKLKAPSNFAVNTEFNQRIKTQRNLLTQDLNTLTGKESEGFWFCSGGGVPTQDRNYPLNEAGTLLVMCNRVHLDGTVQVYYGYRGDIAVRSYINGEWGSWYTIYSTRNTSIDPNGVLTTKQSTVTLTTNDLAKETGNSHSKVMTQKAVTEELDTKFTQGRDLETTDLNTLYGAKNQGVWGQRLTANATTARHYPVNVAGSLVVLFNGTNSRGTIQVYYPYSGAIPYTRALSNAGGDWSEWSKAYSSGNTSIDPNGFLRASGDKTSLTTSGGDLTGTLKFNNANNTIYDSEHISFAPRGSKNYLRKMRGGREDTIWHETVEGGTYRVSTGVEDSKVVLSLNSYNGAYVLGNKVVTEDRIVKDVGDSETNVMSQKAVTAALRGSELIQSAHQIIRDTGGDVSDFNNAKANAAFFGYQTALNGSGLIGVGIDIAQYDGNYRLQLSSSHSKSVIAFRTRNGDAGKWNDWYKLYSTGNTSIDPNGVLTTKQNTVTLTTNDLAKETGNSHSKVMTQKSVTDELNKKVNLTGGDLTGSLKFNHVNNTIYDSEHLSSAPRGSKNYLRKMRGGLSDTIWHETIENTNYRISTGSTDSKEIFKLDRLTGAYVLGNKVVTEDRIVKDVGDSDTNVMSQNAVKKELDKKVSAADLTQTITEDKLKAPSNFAVNTALKGQDPRQWGIGATVQSQVPKLNNLTISKNNTFGLFYSDGDSVGSLSTYGGGIVFGRNPKDSATILYSPDWETKLFLSSALGKGSDKMSEFVEFYSTGNTSIDPNGVLTTKQSTVTLTTNDLAKETGNSHSKVMSQKAISDRLNSIESGHGLGYGQSWVDVTDQRVADATYTNNTGKPIVLAVQAVPKGGSSTTAVFYYVNGINVVSSGSFGDDNSAYYGSSVVIPNGSTYKFKLFRSKYSKSFELK